MPYVKSLTSQRTSEILTNKQTNKQEEYKQTYFTLVISHTFCSYFNLIPVNFLSNVFMILTHCWKNTFLLYDDKIFRLEATWTSHIAFSQNTHTHTYIYTLSLTKPTKFPKSHAVTVLNPKHWHTASSSPTAHCRMNMCSMYRQRRQTCRHWKGGRAWGRVQGQPIGR
jgi:hypothetical protein